MLNEGDYIIVKIPLNGVLLDERNTGESIVVGGVQPRGIVYVYVHYSVLHENKNQ